MVDQVCMHKFGLAFHLFFFISVENNFQQIIKKFLNACARITRASMEGDGRTTSKICKVSPADHLLEMNKRYTVSNGHFSSFLCCRISRSMVRRLTAQCSYSDKTSVYCNNEFNYMFKQRCSPICSL